MAPEPQSGQPQRAPDQAALRRVQDASNARVRAPDSKSLQSLLDAIRPILPHVTLVAQVAKHHADAGDLEGAEAIMRVLVATSPRIAGPYYGLARLAHLAGGADEAVGLLERGLTFEPAHAPSLLLLASILHYVEVAPERVREAHERVGRLIEAGVRPMPPASGRDEPDRRLRIGYMSGDFREHSVSWFMEPLLEHHDRSRFDVWCYSTSARPLDAVTDRLRGIIEGAGGTWRACEGTTDDVLAHQIRADGIDILVELNGLTEGNRLRAVAMRPAPVQVTAIGYPGTTGIRAIDARLVDAITDPPGAEAHCVESLARLGRCFLCYKPPADAPEPRHERNPGDPLTFASFNSLFKFCDRTLDLFASVLRAAPDSRLLLKNQLLDQPFRRARLAASFERRGVDPARLEILGKIPGLHGHLDAYSRADIALDTFPYNGTTTTCEALWMGVPVVTMAGRSHASRVGASLLDAVGLQHLVCDSDETFVRAAVDLVRNPSDTVGTRSALRERMRRSALCDGPAHARAVETLFERLWHDRRHG